MRTTRRLVTAAGLTAGLSATALIAGASPALAYPHPGGYSNGSGLASGTLIALFVLVPVGLALLLAAVVWLPGMAASPGRYRPTHGWTARPVWFSGPVGDLEAAVQHASTGDVTRGGASGSW